MTDIVEWLRSDRIIGTPTMLLKEAADEIERLRHERDKLRDVLVWVNQNCRDKCGDYANVALNVD